LVVSLSIRDGSTQFLKAYRERVEALEGETITKWGLRCLLLWNVHSPHGRVPPLEGRAQVVV
jgi:hypothetical protein